MLYRSTTTSNYNSYYSKIANDMCTHVHELWNMGATKDECRITTTLSFHKMMIKRKHIIFIINTRTYLVLTLFFRSDWCRSAWIAVKAAFLMLPKRLWLPLVARMPYYWAGRATTRRNAPQKSLKSTRTTYTKACSNTLQHAMCMFEKK